MADVMTDEDDFVTTFEAFEQYMNTIKVNPTAEDKAKAKKQFIDIMNQCLKLFRCTCIDGKDKDGMRLALIDFIQNEVRNIRVQYQRTLFSDENTNSLLNKLAGKILSFKFVDYHLVANQLSTAIPHSNNLQIAQCKVTNEGGGTIEIKLDIIWNTRNVWFKDELETIRNDYNYISQNQDAFTKLDVLEMQEILLRQRGLEQVHRYINYSLIFDLNYFKATLTRILPTGDYFFKFNVETSLIPPPQKFVLFRPEVTLSMLKAFQMHIDLKNMSDDMLHSTLENHFLITADDLSFFRRTIERHIKSYN